MKQYNKTKQKSLLTALKVFSYNKNKANYFQENRQLL